MVNNRGPIDACFQEHITYPKQSRFLKICRYLDSTRQGEEDMEAGFSVSRCDVEIYESCKI